MKRVFVLLFPFLSHCFFCCSQSLHRPLSSDFMGIGAYSKAQSDAFTFITNPAVLGSLQLANAGFYGERRFLLKELNCFHAVFQLPTSSGNFGAQASYFGFSAFNELRMALAYGRNLGKKLEFGAQFIYHAIRIAGYGKASAITVGLGTRVHLTDKLLAGISLENPLGASFNKGNNEKLSSHIAVGIGFDPSPLFFVGLEIQKEDGMPPDVRAGFQYKLLPQLLARAGIATATSSVWMGMGIILKSFRIDLISNFHPQLGLTPGVLFLFGLKRNSD